MKRPLGRLNGFIFDGIKGCLGLFYIFPGSEAIYSMITINFKQPLAVKIINRKVQQKIVLVTCKNCRTSPQDKL